MTNHTKFKEDNEIRSKTDNSFHWPHKWSQQKLLSSTSLHILQRGISELDFCPKINSNQSEEKFPINARKTVCSCLNEYLKNHHSFWKTFCLISHSEDTCYAGSKKSLPLFEKWDFKVKLQLITFVNKCVKHPKRL